MQWYLKGVFMKHVVTSLTFIAASLLLPSCNSSGGACVVDTHYVPDLSMLEFSPDLTNPLWLPNPDPEAPPGQAAPEGTKFIFESTDEYIVVEIKGTIDNFGDTGVTVRVVQDTAMLPANHSVILEDTTDYYAQDGDGNVW